MNSEEIPSDTIHLGNINGIVHDPNSPNSPATVTTNSTATGTSNPRQFSLRTWFHDLRCIEKIFMICLAAASLGVAVGQLLASWQVASGVNEQIKTSTNVTKHAEDLYREMYETSERLHVLMNTLVPMTNRLLLMQLCADHPNISTVVCQNVTTWSSEKGYLETGVLPGLFPLNGTEPQHPVPPVVTEPRLSTITATPGGIVATVNCAILGVLFLLGALLLHT